MPGMPTFTKTPPEVIAAFDAASPARVDVQRKPMFGYPALFLRGNMFAGTFGPKIVVRLGEAERAKAVHAGATPFEPMPGRAMKEYVVLPASAMKGAPLKRWLALALANAETLPAKAAKKPAAKRR